MEKRVMIATVISMIILLVFWSNFQSKPVPVSVKPIPAQSPIEATGQKDIVSLSQEKQAGASLQIVKIDTETSAISLSTHGGGMIEWKIKEKNGKWVSLTPADLNDQSAVLTLHAKQEPLAKVVFKADKTNLSLKKGEEGKITLSAQISNGLSVIRQYTFQGEGYLQKVETRFVNNGKIATRTPEYSITWGDGLNPLKNKTENNTVSSWLNGNLQKKIKGQKEGDVSWVALDSQYFMVAMIPQESSFSGVVSQLSSNKKLAGGLFQKDFTLEPGQIRQDSFNVYAGPKEYYTLKAVAPHLEQLVGFGSIGKVFYFVLVGINKVVHNYGWAIIILTLILQVILFPLTIKSYKSMKEMQALQPLIKELQLKYKEDQKRLNIEIMNLYKSHKMNPLGGCLPMLLQLPIFFALFNAIKNAVELRQTPFIFWIKDLSLPDTIAQIGSININVLPLIMGLAMFIQQKMSTVDPQQAKMMMFMPVLFTFMFWNFPSGLVLYWFINSIVSMAGQYFVINKKPPKVEIVR